MIMIMSGSERLMQLEFDSSVIFLIIKCLSCRETCGSETRYVYTTHGPKFLIHFEASAKLAKQCAPLGIHLEPINKQLMLLVKILS